MKLNTQGNCSQKIRRQYKVHDLSVNCSEAEEEGCIERKQVPEYRTQVYGLIPYTFPHCM